MGHWHNKCSQILTSLVKIQIDVTLWFENDLCLVNNENMHGQHQQWQKMWNNKKMRMPTRNDKMTTNNNGVSEKHVENLGCAKTLDMKLKKKKQL